MSVVPQFKVVSIETPPVTDLSYVSGCRGIPQLGESINDMFPDVVATGHQISPAADSGVFYVSVFYERRHGSKKAGGEEKAAQDGR